MITWLRSDQKEAQISVTLCHNLVSYLRCLRFDRRNLQDTFAPIRSVLKEIVTNFRARSRGQQAIGQLLRTLSVVHSFKTG